MGSSSFCMVLNLLDVLPSIDHHRRVVIWTKVVHIRLSVLLNEGDFVEFSRILTVLFKSLCPLF